VFCFIRDLLGFRLGRFLFLAFENLQQMHLCRPAHLFEPFYRYDGGKGLTLALDNKLIVSSATRFRMSPSRWRTSNVDIFSVMVALP
jgi:hypothetical protein